MCRLPEQATEYRQEPPLFGRKFVQEDELGWRPLQPHALEDS